MAEEERVQAVCPWCSAQLPSADVGDCPGCGARLVETGSEEIPGVTAVDPQLLRAAPAQRKVKRTFGALLIGDDEEIPAPSDAEMPALARPDEDVRREMLRLEIEAGLADLRAERRVLEAEALPSDAGEMPAVPPTPGPEPAGTGPEPDAAPTGLAPAAPEIDRGP
jgi:hypothetical protein